MVDTDLRKTFDLELPTSCWEGISQAGPMLNLPALGGCPVRLNINMLRNLVCIDQYDEELIKVSECSCEENVAATILLLHSVSENVRKQFIDKQWFKTPLQYWMKLSGWLDSLNAFGVAVGASASEWSLLRGIKKVLVRSNAQADWEQELKNRTNPRVYCMPYAGSRSIEKFDISLSKHIEALCSKLVDNMGKRRGVTTAYDYWQNRANTIAPGSSHIRGIVGELENDKRLSKQDRANKKVVVEFLDDDLLSDIIYGTQGRNIGHASTKFEPGLKQRALFASSDIEYFVASYASADHEKHMSFDGMLGKQAIADLIGWMQLTYEKDHSASWCCADFSDFNIEHNTEFMVAMELALARAWLRTYDDGSAVDKVAAHLWNIDGYYNSWVSVGSEDLHRVYQGLFSGSRDTARNNTMLHKAYALVNKDMLEMMDANVVMCKEYYSGDDEDTLFENTAQALDWVRGYQITGHALNPTKQLVSSNRHEFLKMFYDGFSIPNRPLGSIVATLATGNWYVQSAVWYKTAIETVVANWSDAVSRGLRWDYGQKLAAMVLDGLYRVDLNKYSLNDIDLDGNDDIALFAKQNMKILQSETGRATYYIEWWEHAAASIAAELFWNGSNAGKVKLEVPDDCIRSNDKFKSNATDAMLRGCAAQLKLLTSESQELLREQLLTNSYAKMFHAERLKMSRKQALYMPARKSRIEDKSFTNCTMVTMPCVSEFLELLNSVGDKNASSTSWDETYARVGLLPSVGNVLGNVAALRSLKDPSKIAKWSEPVINENLTGKDLDMAITPMLRNTVAANCLRRRKQCGGAEKREFELVYAINCAGKTTWNIAHPEALDVDNALMKLKIPHIARYCAPALKQAHAISIVNYAKASGHVKIIGQRLMDNIVDVIGVRQIKSLRHVRPPDELIIPRMEARGWNKERIDMRLKQHGQQYERLRQRLPVERIVEATRM